MTLDEAKQEAMDAMNAYPNSCPRINIYATNILFFADTIAELEAHNRQLLNDKDASPAVIAGYRARNEYLSRVNAELEAKVEELDTLLSTDGGYYSGILKGRVEQREKDAGIAENAFSDSGWSPATTNAAIIIAKAIREGKPVKD